MLSETKRDENAHPIHKKSRNKNRKSVYSLHDIAFVTINHVILYGKLAPKIYVTWFLNTWFSTLQKKINTRTCWATFFKTTRVINCYARQKTKQYITNGNFPGTGFRLNSMMKLQKNCQNEKLINNDEFVNFAWDQWIFTPQIREKRYSQL